MARHEKELAKDIIRRDYLLDTREGRINVTCHSPMQPNPAEAPILMAGGWATAKGSLDPMSEYLARTSGADTMYFAHSRRGGKVEDERSFPREELRKAKMLISLAEHQLSQRNATSPEVADSRMRLLAHSEGAIYAMIAAVLRPDLFSSVVLYAPAGLQGRDTLPELIVRFIREMRQDKPVREDMADLETLIRMHAKSRLTVSPPDQVRKQQRGGLNTIARHLAGNLPRSLQEGRAIANTDIFPLIQEARGQGVRVGIIAPANDVVMPNERIQWQSGITAEDIDGYLVIRGIHGDILTQPGVVGVAIQELFNKFGRQVIQN